MPSRYAGDFHGKCTNCDEYVEFAVGIRPGADPVAMHFGPGGPRATPIRSAELAVMVEDSLDLRFEFECPICEAWSRGRVTCRATP